MNLTKLTSVLIVSIMLFSCSSSSNDDLTNEPDPTPTTITYNNKVKGIINSNCGSCHGNPTDNAAPVSYNTFNLVKNDIDDIISRINSAASPMPPTGLMSQSLRDDIQKWKDDGLLEN